MMPGGYKSSSHIAKQFFKQMDTPTTMLDIGAGAGFYGQAISDLFPKCQSTAIEIESDYIQAYALKSNYKWVRGIDASCLLGEDGHYNLVIFGDVIEHFPKSLGIDLIHHFVYRAQYILVVFPEMLQQDSWQGHRSEMHRSHWDIQDFRHFNYQHTCIQVGRKNNKRPKHIVGIDGLDEHDKRWSKARIHPNKKD